MMRPLSAPPLTVRFVLRGLRLPVLVELVFLFAAFGQLLDLGAGGGGFGDDAEFHRPTQDVGADEAVHPRGKAFFLILEDLRGAATDVRREVVPGEPAAPDDLANLPGGEVLDMGLRIFVFAKSFHGGTGRGFLQGFATDWEMGVREASEVMAEL